VGLTPVEVTTAFRRAYKKKPQATRDKIDKALSRLRAESSVKGTHRVWGTKGVYEARLDGANRLTFHWDNDTIVLRQNCNHDILRRP